eukprot:SAG11_NODE_3089_length_2702_cov_3.781022_2_plen_60_part_00
MAFVAATRDTRDPGAGHVALAGWHGAVLAEAIVAEATQSIVHRPPYATPKNKGIHNIMV